jgi:hypothetical protein
MRIGLNLSNELLERLKPLKNTVNLSQICRDAIKSRIETYERAINQANSDGMQAVADKLWLEYSKRTILDWESIGCEDAKVWVQLATLQDFEDLFHNIGIHKRKGLESGQFLARIIPEAKWFGERQQEHKEWFQRQCELDETTNPFIQAELEYNRGWISYVTAVWNMVKKRITDDATARGKSRQQVKDKPEIPNHLVDSSE